MVRTAISILTLLCCVLCRAQTDSVPVPNKHPYNFKVAYNSSVIYPGMSIGAELYLQKKNMEILRKSGESNNYTRARLISGNVNWYHHPEFHDNLYFTAEYVMRRTNIRGFIKEFTFGPGFSRTFLGGTTYKVNNSGDVSIVRNAGYNYALITIGGGIGVDLSVRYNLPAAVMANFNMISMFPYNSTIYFRPMLELGVRSNPFRRKHNQ
jgi:hypothetical protein